HELRRILGEESIITRGDVVGIDAGRVGCDALQLRDCIRDGDLIAAMDLYRGDLLPGFFLDGCAAFDAWLEQLRSELRNAARGAAAALERRAVQSGDLMEATSWCRRGLAIAPTDEK